MQVVVLTQSRTGTTRRAGELVVEALAERSLHAVHRPVTRPDLDELAAADLVVVGTWCDGAIFFGHRPGEASKLRRLPVLHGTPAAAFVTYAHHAGKATRRMARLLEGRGLRVVATEALRRDLLPAGVDDLIDRALAQVSASAAH